MLKYLILFLMISLNCFANMPDFDIKCDDKQIASAFREYINSSKNTPKNIIDFRADKLMLKTSDNFVEVNEISKEDSIALLEKTLMLKINDGINNYKICKNNNIYFLAYQKNQAIAGEFYDFNKKIYETEIK